MDMQKLFHLAGSFIFAVTIEKSFLSDLSFKKNRNQFFAILNNIGNQNLLCTSFTVFTLANSNQSYQDEN